MKKILLAGLLLLSASCFAQNSGQSFLSNIADRLSFGLRAGANYSNFHNAGFTTDPLVGFNSGATVNFRLSDHWSVVEDILYSTEGAKSTGSLFGGKDIKLSYLNIPILYRYKTNSGLFFEFGEQAGIKLREQMSGFNGDFGKTLNFSAAGGLGYQTPSGLGLSLRYYYGLSNVGNSPDLPVGGNFKSNTAQASLFYTF